MNIYQKRQRWKMILLIFAIAIGVLSLWYTNRLVASLAQEELRKVQIWADAILDVQSADILTDNINFEAEVVRSNTTTPLIMTNEQGKIISFRNLDSVKAQRESYLKEQLEIMKSQHSPIVLSFKPNEKQSDVNFREFKNYVYYKDSDLLIKLRYYPYFQLTVVGLFIFVSYLAFNTSKRAEQNQVWVGMAKETAHQLGTPISSLIAWLEYLKLKGIGEEISSEIEKDIKRLQTITERFSKIGSAPELKKADLIQVISGTLEYLKTRASSKISFSFVNNAPSIIYCELNIPLFEWVIENVTKNAIDAMTGAGSLTVAVSAVQHNVYVDISDTGKGIPKAKFRTIFNPGYTTKSRGWGLGLTLAKRIVEEYHSGIIYVKDSEPGKGTTFRIVLKNCLA
jgi:nitrogen-specific signal transduction histidine kinase